MLWAAGFEDIRRGDGFLLTSAVEQDDISRVALKVQENSSATSLFGNHDQVTQDKLKLSDIWNSQTETDPSHPLTSVCGTGRVQGEALTVGPHKVKAWIFRSLSRINLHRFNVSTSFVHTASF